MGVQRHLSAGARIAPEVSGDGRDLDRRRGEWPGDYQRPRALGAWDHWRDPEGGKYARAQAASPIVEAGNVWLPNPRPHGRLRPERAWVEDFLHQLCVFPTGAHDDDVDAFSQLVARCIQPEIREWISW